MAGFDRSGGAKTYVTCLVPRSVSARIRPSSQRDAGGSDNKQTARGVKAQELLSALERKARRERRKGKKGGPARGRDR